MPLTKLVPKKQPKHFVNLENMGKMRVQSFPGNRINRGNSRAGKISALLASRRVRCSIHFPVSYDSQE